MIRRFLWWLDGHPVLAGVIDWLAAIGAALVIWWLLIH